FSLEQVQKRNCKICTIVYGFGSFGETRTGSFSITPEGQVETPTGPSGLGALHGATKKPKST
uniref:Uncharacterized protein n=1 Tax=Oryza brachyantha TaxID=4533 RepID=J3LT46_ORYBR